MNALEKEYESRPKKINYLALIFAVILILGLTLPFHYVPQNLTVFPKDNLTMKYTFIFKSDIDTIVEKYNQSGFSEKELLKEDPFIKKLFEKGLLIHASDSSKNQNNNKKAADESTVPLRQNTDTDLSPIVQIDTTLHLRQFLRLKDILEFVKRKEFSIPEIKDYLSQASSLNWSVDLYEKDFLILPGKLADDFEMTYNPENHSLIIETYIDDVYNTLIKEFDKGNFSKKVYPNKLTELTKTTYRNNNYNIIFNMEHGGSMGNTNYTITISRSPNFKE